MNNANKTIGWVLVVLVVLGLGYWGYTSMSTNNSTSQNSTNSHGSVTVSFTDATTDIQNVSEVSMKVDKVELYSAGQGWVTVSDNNAAYNLLDLHEKGRTVIYGKGDVTADSYSKTRVTLSSVTVMTRNDGNKEAALPSKVLDIEGKINVVADTDTSLKFDVLADRSLHVTAKNAYVFAPVVKVESRSQTDVQAAIDGGITVSGGSLDTNETIGMDLNGNTQAGFELDSSAKLDVGAGGVINVLSGPSGMLRINNSSGATTTTGTVNGTVNGVINY